MGDGISFSLPLAVLPQFDSESRGKIQTWKKKCFLETRKILPFFTCQFIPLGFFNFYVFHSNLIISFGWKRSNPQFSSFLSFLLLSSSRKIKQIWFANTLKNIVIPWLDLTLNTKEWLSCALGLTKTNNGMRLSALQLICSSFQPQ